MKKISTLLLSSLFSLSLLAYNGSGLSITSISTNMNYKVEIDGKRVFMRGNSVTLDYLREGYHSVRIYREVKRNDFGNRFGQKDQLMYSTSVYISRKLHTDIIINRSGKVFVDSYMVGPETDWYTDEEDDYNDDNIDADDGGWNHGYGNVMKDREFSGAKEQIRKEWFENTRLTLAKTIIDGNNFTTIQVKEMMLLFTFENNRLELAKYAYRKTADKNNYYQLNDALTFSSSKDELARFIRESR